MSDTVILGVLSLIGTIASVVVTAFVAIKLGHVETKVDGKMDSLLAASIGRATAEGRAVGEQAQRDRASIPPSAEPVPVTVQNTTDEPVPVAPIDGKP